MRLRKASDRGQFAADKFRMDLDAVLPHPCKPILPGGEQTNATFFSDPLTIHNGPKTDFPTNQSDPQTRVYQIDEHGRRLSGSRQKSSRHRSAAMMVVKIYLEQLVKEINSSLLLYLVFRFGTGIENDSKYLARYRVQHLQVFWQMALNKRNRK